MKEGEIERRKGMMEERREGKNGRRESYEV